MGATWVKMDVTSDNVIEETELQCNSVWASLVFVSYSKLLTNSL